MVMTALILFVTASSLYAVDPRLLRGSRSRRRATASSSVSLAALHPTKHFPHVSLLTIGAVTIPFCFFSLGQLVSWLIQVQILLQFIWQCAGVILLRRYRPDIVAAVHDVALPAAGAGLAGVWIYIFFIRPGRRHRVLVRLPGDGGRGVFRVRQAPGRVARDIARD